MKQSWGNPLRSCLPVFPGPGSLNSAERLGLSAGPDHVPLTKQTGHVGVRSFSISVSTVGGYKRVSWTSHPKNTLADTATGPCTRGPTAHTMLGPVSLALGLGSPVSGQAESTSSPGLRNRHMLGSHSGHRTMSGAQWGGLCSAVLYFLQ